VIPIQNGVWLKHLEAFLAQFLDILSTVYQEVSRRSI
jgi:hypothetical protein